MAQVADLPIKKPIHTFQPGGFSRLSQILEKIPPSRSGIYRMIGSGTFPKQIKLGLRASAWKNDELNAFDALVLNGWTGDSAIRVARLIQRGETNEDALVSVLEDTAAT